MNRRSILRGTFAVTAIFLVGCSSPKVKSESAKKTMAAESSAGIEGFVNEDPSLRTLMDKAVGYAIFPEIGKAGFIAGGSYGKGEVYEGGRKIGYADVTQATFGLQAGAQTFSELLLFMRQKEMDDFKADEFKLAGNVSVVAIKAGAADTADPSKGIIAFVRTKGGMMAEAAIGGQRLRFHPDDSTTTRPSGN